VGRIEDITLSYVVVHIWDDRRLIFPTSYFTQKPFQNWTRTESAILGTVEFDVDWAVPVDAMRDELRRIVEQTDLWDRRVSVLQVTDAVNGFVRVRALVSAADAISGAVVAVGGRFQTAVTASRSNAATSPRRR
jgi:hypothetical protein